MWREETAVDKDGKEPETESPYFSPPLRELEGSRLGKHRYQNLELRPRADCERKEPSDEAPRNALCLCTQEQAFCKGLSWTMRYLGQERLLPVLASQGG